MQPWSYLGTHVAAKAKRCLGPPIFRTLRGGSVQGYLGQEPDTGSSLGNGNYVGLGNFPPTPGRQPRIDYNFLILSLLDSSVGHYDFIGHGHSKAFCENGSPGLLWLQGTGPNFWQHQPGMVVLDLLESSALTTQGVWRRKEPI